MERIKTIETRDLAKSLQTAVAANARHHVSPLARPLAALLTRNAKKQTNNTESAGSRYAMQRADGFFI